MLSLENFLDKDDRLKFDFLRLLEESSDLTALNTTIQAQLSLSNFLFNKTIEELSLDFENYGLEVYFAIDSNNVQTTLLEVGQATSDLLLAHYLRNSLSFAILLALFREDYQSANNFALESYTSYTNVYSHTQQIKKLLKELGIKDTDKEVKARVVIWYQSEQSDLFFSQIWQVKLIGGGKPCKALQIEFFKPCGKGYLDTL